MAEYIRQALELSPVSFVQGIAHIVRHPAQIEVEGEAGIVRSIQVVWSTH